MQISFTNPYNRAWLRMKSALFGPLDLGKWFALGFTAWLAQLDPDWVFSFQMDAGSLGNLFRFEDVSSDFSGWDVPSLFQIPAWSVPLVIAMAIGGLLIGLLLLWIQSRGKLMFLDNLVHDRAEVVRPWHEQASLGDSVFLWHVFFTVINMAVFGTLVLAMTVGLFLPGWLDFPPAGQIIMAIVSGTILFMLTMVSVYVHFFMNRFVILLMYRDRIGVIEGWRRFMTLFGQDPASFVFYGIFYLIALVVGWMLFLIMGFITCCVGLFMIGIPYIGTVVTLPLPVLLRYMDLEFLAQFEEGDDLLSPLPPTKGPSPEFTDPAADESIQVDGEGTVIGSEDVGPDAGGSQAGPQDP